MDCLMRMEETTEVKRGKLGSCVREYLGFQVCAVRSEVSSLSREVDVRYTS